MEKQIGATTLVTKSQANRWIQQVNHANCLLSNSPSSSAPFSPVDRPTHAPRQPAAPLSESQRSPMQAGGASSLIVQQGSCTGHTRYQSEAIENTGHTADAKSQSTVPALMPFFRTFLDPRHGPFPMGVDGTGSMIGDSTNDQRQCTFKCFIIW